MKVKEVTTEYVIDLNEDEEDRWSEVIRKERRVAKAMIRDAAKDFTGYDPATEPPGVLVGVLMKIVENGFKFSGGLYQKELRTWAEAVDVSPAELIFLNCHYEICQLSQRAYVIGQRVPDWLLKMVGLGCTCGAVRIGKNRVVHLRNMDWPLRHIGKATRIFRFTDDGREFVTVGMPGMIGALSGMVPGGYSASINFAPPTFIPGFDFGPLFLLRHVFETCDTYEEACHALSRTKLSANVLFMVCSADGKACLIERTRKDFAKVPIRGEALAVANHYSSAKFRNENKDADPEFIEHSKERAATMVEGLKSFGPGATLDELACVLAEDPVLNDITHQMMVFDPSDGEMLAWAR